MQHRKIRSHRETSPMPAWRPPTCRSSYPAELTSLQAEHHPRSKGMREASRKLSQSGLQEASFRQAQDIAASLPMDRSAPASHRKTPKRSLTAKALLEHFTLEGETNKLLPEHPPTQQLDSDKLEHVMLELEALQKVVRKLARSRLPPTLADELAANSCNMKKKNNNNTNNNNNNTTNTTNNTNNNNNDDNNYNNNNNKNSQESGLNSFDLDNDNPESEPDLDSTSLGSLSPNLGVESSLDQQGANQSLKTIGQEQTMTIGISFGSLIQQNQDGQEGMQIGTAWDPSLMHKRPKKKVSFDETSLAHHRKQQNIGQQQAKGLDPANFQLRQLGSNTEKQELPEQNNKTTTAQTCWNSFQQTNLQQQSASALEKELQHKACQNNSLGREDQTLGSLESVTHIQQACRFPSHNTNTSNLGIGTKNTAAWGILVDTGAAISLAPRSFAQHIELSPFESTLQLRSITGEVIQAFGRRTVQLVGANLSFQVSFVIANVQHALLGMDALMSNQLSLMRNIFNEYYLVNAAGATTQLKTTGQLLYIEACSREFGFSNCRGSSFQNQTGSLLNDKGRTQEEAVATSGGACYNSFPLENLREQQAKNTANLGTTTASPGKGAKRRKKKKPSAKKASQDRSQRSLEQQGQQPATTQPRSLEKTRIIDELEMVAEKEEQNSLGSKDLQNLSVRILLTLSLRNKWLITTTRATGACSQDALGEQA